VKPILVLLPSLDRPVALAESVGCLAVNGTGKFDLLTLGGGGGATKALNSVPMELIRQYEVIGLYNDDTRMRTAGWDELVLERLEGRRGLVYGMDGIQNERLCTHPFISARIVEAVGFIQPACLYHYYGDNFWMELLGPLGAVEYCAALFTEHRHAGVLGRAPDGTARLEMAHWDADSAAWREFLEKDMPAVRERVRGVMGMANVEH
jgi:hypothetical protein